MKKILLLAIVGLWISIALLIQLTFVTLSFVSPKKASELAREITYKIDGRFSN